MFQPRKVATGAFQLFLPRDLPPHPPVVRDRVYLTGISMGGYGTWHIATADPERFAAIVALEAP